MNKKYLGETWKQENEWLEKELEQTELEYAQLRKKIDRTERWLRWIMIISAGLLLIQLINMFRR